MAPVFGTFFLAGIFGPLALLCMLDEYFSPKRRCARCGHAAIEHRHGERREIRGRCREEGCDCPIWISAKELRALNMEPPIAPRQPRRPRLHEAQTEDLVGLRLAVAHRLRAEGRNWL